MSCDNISPDSRDRIIKAMDRALIGMRKPGVYSDLFSNDPKALGYMKNEPVHYKISMTPTDFLMSASRREGGLYNTKSANDFINNRGDRKLFPPALRVRVDGDKAIVSGHEGRHRSNLAYEVQGDQHIPVNINVVGSDKGILDLPLISQDGNPLGRTLRDMMDNKNLPLKEDVDRNRRIEWEKRRNVKVSEGYGDHWVISNDLYDAADLLGGSEAIMIHGEQDVGMVNPVKLSKLLGESETKKIMAGDISGPLKFNDTQEYAARVKKATGGTSELDYNRYDKAMQLLGYSEIKPPVLTGKIFEGLDISKRTEHFDNIYHETSGDFKLSDGKPGKGGNNGSSFYVSYSDIKQDTRPGSNKVLKGGATSLNVVELSNRMYTKLYINIADQFKISPNLAKNKLNSMMVSQGVDAIKTETPGHKKTLAIINKNAIKKIGGSQ